MNATLPSFYEWTLSELKSFLTAQGMSPYMAQQLFQWVYQKNERNPDHFSNIKKESREWLKNHINFQPGPVYKHLTSVDGTEKFLVQLKDGKNIETVWIPTEKRNTVCLSTQVGCKMGCQFCVTGKMGFLRNMSTAEIVGQLMAIPQFQEVTNLVFMGEGEPLDNIEAVLKSIEIFREAFGLAISHHKITLSTSGLAPKIIEFAHQTPVNLAISLHAVDDELRNKLMPVNRAYNLKTLIAALKVVPLKHRKRITFEYIVFGDLNDDVQHAQELIKLLNPLKAKVNLIPYHANPYASFKSPTLEKLNAFSEYLMNKGLQCNIRQSRGLDIQAACGLLVSRENNEELKPMIKSKSLF